MTLTGVETVAHEGSAYALIIRANAASDAKYNFLTDSANHSSSA